MCVSFQVFDDDALKERYCGFSIKTLAEQQTQSNVLRIYFRSDADYDQVEFEISYDIVEGNIPCQYGHYGHHYILSSKRTPEICYPKID